MANGRISNMKSRRRKTPARSRVRLGWRKKQYNERMAAIRAATVQEPFNEVSANEQ